MLDRLPFKEIWLCDTEFGQDSNLRPEVRCVVLREMRSGRTLKYWADECPTRAPFPLDASSLFVAYTNSAEFGSFLQLGWGLPARTIDLYVEHRNATNPSTGNSLLDALEQRGITWVTTKEEKRTMRDLALRGGSYTDAEKRALLDYCEQDTLALEALLPRMLPTILEGPGGHAGRLGLGHALWRGRYMKAVARMERAGIPQDVELLKTLRAHWDPIRLAMVREYDPDSEVFDANGSLRQVLFEGWLARRGIPWVRTATGLLATDSDTFRDLGKARPEVRRLGELVYMLNTLKLESLAVGADGRARTMLSPFQALTGRNAPSTSEYPFGPAVWIRGLIVPPPGWALAYCDWSSQEIAIAAMLSEDKRLLADVQADPYLAFGRRIGMLPENATKDSHGAVRDMLKVLLLASNYGAGAETLALQADISVAEASYLLRQLRQTYRVYTDWRETQVSDALLRHYQQTAFGWHRWVRPRADGRPILNSLRNFAMQAGGAEMLKIACCLLTEQNPSLIAGPVHDAVLVQAPEDGIEEAVVATKAAMAEASETMLGFTIRAGVTIIRPGERYMDPRGVEMWNRVMRKLEEVTGDKR